MLFRTVFGAELEAIYSYIAHTRNASRDQIRRSFMPEPAGTLSTQSIDDALAFLESAHLITVTDLACAPTMTLRVPFNLLILRNLTALQQGRLPVRHKLDPLYLTILDELFVQPNRSFIPNLHIAVNHLRSVSELGGLSKEKVGAWARVMASLHVGKRLRGGFQYTCSPSLIHAIVRCWDRTEDDLQYFLEQHLSVFLPFQTAKGDIADAIALPLLHLAEQGVITLTSRHDSPRKAYFGDRRLRYIAVPPNKSDVN